MNPEKTRSVACPRIRGPIDIRSTDPTVRATTSSAAARSGRIRATIRLADGPKSIAFCPTMPPPIGPRPGPATGASMRSVAASAFPFDAGPDVGVEVGVGVGVGACMPWSP